MADDNRLTIKYDGLDADKHELDMRRFGESLVGLERLAQVGIVAVTERRFPGTAEKLPLQLKVRTPEEGSVELILFVQWAGYALPVLQEIMKDSAKSLLTNWFGWIFKKMGGREKEADPHFRELMRLTEKIHEGASADRQRDREFLLSVLDRALPAAKKAVSPIGPSCDTLQIGEPGAAPQISVDAPMADAIRSGDADREVGDLETMRVRMEGFKRHNRQLSIEHPDKPGKFLTADVRDPAFDTMPNVYTDAATSLGWLEVKAKPTVRDGELVRLHILDAKAA